MKLFDGKQMHAIDEKAIHEYKIPSLTLMENAGKAFFLWMEKLIKKDSKIIIVCGSGNNGGDGYVIASYLKQANYDVSIFALSLSNLSEDCLVNYERCKADNIKFVDSLNNCDVVVDAIFGTGLSRNIEGNYATVINEINTLNAIKLSVDIPSGVDAGNGSILGVAVKSDYTLTFQSGKIGLYIYPGREFAGEVIVLDIGIPYQVIDEAKSNIFLIEKIKMSGLLPKRMMHSNKSTYGRVLCVGGSEEMPGAISLAALSALRSGCGLLTCAIPKCIQQIVACNVLESMNIPLSDIDGHISKLGAQELKQRQSVYSHVLVGCGITRSSDIEEVMHVLLESDKPLVIDADGLYILQSILPQYKNRKNIIVTPHIKEFARLVGKDVKEIIENPIDEVIAFNNQYPNITVVLKSETTLIAYQGQVYINTYGNNGLAKGGSGDVLAGIITGLYAQNNDAFKSAILGVFLHAYSADCLLEKQSVYSIIPSDVYKAIDGIIKELEGEQ